MKILDYIRNVFVKKSSVLSYGTISGGFAFDGVTAKPFGELIWLNICDLICDLAESINIELKRSVKAEKNYKGVAFRTFFYSWGRFVWQKLFDEGFVVIAYNGVNFRILRITEYTTYNVDGMTVVRALDETLEVYVMRSATYALKERSDKSLCRPWIDYLDSVMTASNESCKRMGACVVASPKTPNNSPTSVILDEKSKTQLEKQLQNEYGLLAQQKSVMVLPREMSWQVVSLANLDLKLNDKARLAILAICDRIKVPANQVAIIDANASKSLSNGSELREGDRSKYKTVRRLFENTFVQMANTLSLSLTYSIDGEPLEDTISTKSETTETTETTE